VDAIPDRSQVLLSFQRTLAGGMHAQLRQASVELHPSSQIVRVRFEYDGTPDAAVKETCSSAATDVISEFPAPWDLNVEHRVVPYPHRLSALENVVYVRRE
jgi:hypothetical protein